MTGKRRSRGEGSIQRNEDGSGWVAIFELPRGPNGRRQRRKRRARTQAEARVRLREMRQQYESNGRLADQTRTVPMTMADYLDVRRADGLARSSLDREERFGALVSLYFETTRTAKLSVQDCDRFLEQVALGMPDRSGQPTRPLVGRDHLRRLRSTLRRALHNDARRGLLLSNVADLAQLPADTGSRSSLRALTKEELARLLDSADGSSALLIDLIGRHGLRPAEARALTWDSVDLIAGTLTVLSQMNARNEFAPTKTVRATRSIRLHASSVESLTRWQATEDDRRARAGTTWADLGLVAPTSIGTPIDRNNFVRSLRQLCERVDIRPAVSPYELRHTAITHQCEAGYPAWQVADWAGTSEKMLYLHYRHQLKEVSDLLPLHVP